MGRPPQYTISQKKQALDTWRTKGVTAAAREVGCTTKTIYDWVDQEGLRGNQDKESIYQHKLNGLKFKLMERVYYLLNLMRSEHIGYAHYQGSITEYEIALPSSQDVKNYAIAMSIIMDRIALMEGKPTSRVEQIDGNVLEKELQNLANELADKAQGLTVNELPSETDLAMALRQMEEGEIKGEGEGGNNGNNTRTEEDV